MKRDTVTEQIIEPCKGCPISPPFSWKVCLQCQREIREDEDFVIILPKDLLEVSMTDKIMDLEIPTPHWEEPPSDKQLIKYLNRRVQNLENNLRWYKRGFNRRGRVIRKLKKKEEHLSFLEWAMIQGWC